MPQTKSDSTSALAGHRLHPAIAEARLLNEKHANDRSYVARLIEELESIESTITAMEERVQLDPCSTDSRPRPWRVLAKGSDASSIRELSGELDRRLRRLQHATQPGCESVSRS